MKALPLIYEKRIVVFLDILGFSTMIEDSKVDTPLRRKIKRAVEIIRESADTDETGRAVSTFSDSAVISYPLHKESSLFYLLIDIIHLQLKIGALGIMFRGGIAIGDCFHDGNIIFGPAMNEAYRLESKVAKWPRVVISEETLKDGLLATIKPNPYGVEYDMEDVLGLLKRDDYQNNIKELSDETDSTILYFVDFLSQSEELVHHGDEYLEWLRDFRVAIVEGLNRFSSVSDDVLEEGVTKSQKGKVFKKYRWLLEYWNSVIEDDNAEFPVPNIDIENQEKFREMYKKLRIRKVYPYI